MRVLDRGLLPAMLLLACSVPVCAEEPAYFRDPVEQPLLSEPQNQQVSLEQFEDAKEKQEYQETYLVSQTIDGELLNPERYVQPPQRQLPFLLRFRSGASYFDNGPQDDIIDSKVGASYSVDGLLPIYRALTFYGSFSGNHFSEGSQYLGTVGVLKVANRRSRNMGEWLGWGILFDSYTDTRIDDLFDSQVRLNVNMMLTDRSTVGLTYYEPIERDAFIPFIGAPSVPFFSSNAIEGYLSHRFDWGFLTASLAYRDEDSAEIYGLMASVPLADNVNLLAQNRYDSIGRWSNWFGVEIYLGRKSSSSCSECASNDYRRDVVRGSDEGDRESSAVGDVNAGASADNSIGVSLFYPDSLADGISAWDGSGVVVGGSNPGGQGPQLQDQMNYNAPVMNFTPTDYQQLMNTPTIPDPIPTYPGTGGYNP